ncbi:PH, RCC1 and FYVE domains-containing protein 1-like isoform X2 [Hibiscus syriacus]|uniref:PH, RCC1 and FYVE domains-containing protein 1-like isoform X2 n=1 Tax=Hibiscus syriacus TaxID=106335 RepID=UPI0019218E51|nr:PH, RCC1 and FYVE domains-containing protein 1-like isoform X2 [Hibiscus syriacus]
MSRTDRMASDLISRTGPVERDIGQAITALKKGACLLKYGRRGKPKFCPFRLSNDESVLIWFSGKEEKHLKLSHVSRIISGQRTPIFQRYPRPEKEYQSFSLVYNNRSLDLICKDKDEAEVWFSGLKALISRSHQRKWRTESRSDGIPSEANSPKTYTQSSPLHSPFGSNDSLQKDGDHLRLHSPYDSPPKNALGGSDSVHGHMKTMAMDVFRVSLSSAVSSSSQGSGHDDGDALGDVFIWGEGTGDGVLGGGFNKVSSCGIKMDSLLPKALESAVVLDVQNIACGGRHAALVTKQGEVFSWGEESGGRLGHGVDSDVLHPKLIDALSNTNIELVACGEYHTCAVTLSGDLYTWGDGTYNFGLLGHGNEVSHWVPKRVNEPLEGIHVSSISCGPWHTAVVTSAGQLFTFGDGTFGVLGHGDRNSVSLPREVESLKGLRTVRAACGVWHSAAVVEVMVGNSSSSNCSSGKLFTWGDGDKGRLGHGDKETKLVPTCVAALVEPNFCQVACGHSMTVTLTTLGHVYTMGSPVYGQLGNPQADGKVPTRVEGKLSKSFVEEISCGAYHVAVLTSRTEVYTWGKGANGRLGHGNTEDKNTPTLVEALKDKQVKSIACGTNFTAAICLHKWVSGVDQSMCSGCRLPFNFKRKRHNCYNCGLVFCHACSSKKCLKASMAPNPNKPYRVCDNCFNRLKKDIETDASSQSSISRRGSINRGTGEFVDKDDKLDSRSHAQLARFSPMGSLKQGESRSKENKKLEFNSSRVSPVPNGGFHRGTLNISKSFNPVFGSSKKCFSASVPGSRVVSRATSPISKQPSPARSTTPIPTVGGLTSPKIVLDDVKKTNDGLSQEVIRFRTQVENLTRKAQLQEVDLERTTKQLKEAIAIAEEETAKCKAAKEVIKSLTAQLKDMAERLPVGAARNIKSPSLTSYGSSPPSNDVSSVSFQRLNGQISCGELDSNIRSSQLLSNGSSTAGNHSSCHNKQGQIEPATKSGSRTKESEPRNETEWVEQDEPGVYITLTSLPGGAKDLKRVRFSRKRFSEKQAEQWWAENRARVYEQYNVRKIDKSSVGIGSVDLAH